MKRHFAFTATFAVLSVACSNEPTRPVVPPTVESVAQFSDVIPGQYIVALRPTVQDVEGLARTLARLHGGTLRFTYKHALKGFSIRLSDAAAAGLARHPLVESVEHDQVIRLSETQQSNVTWGLDRVDQRDLPLDASYFYTPTGFGVKVYILDTGIRLTHQEFRRSDGSSRAITGRDFVTSGGTASDCNGHGTHVADTVGGKTWGVAKEVTLVSVRVLDCNGNSSVSTAMAGVDWVTGDHQPGQPAVANMSFGGKLSIVATSIFNNVVQGSIQDGVTYAVSAGNSNEDACNFSPARAHDALTVAASNQSDARPSFSNWGSCVDMFAPGVGVTSAWWTSDFASAILDGTSMAAPHVAGAAALYLQTDMAASPATVELALKSHGTSNKIIDPRGSPNLLLYTRWIGL